MAAYVRSLTELSRDHAGLEWLAPGHGFLMDQPRRAFDAIVAHRLQREAKVVERLARLGTTDLATLVASVYDDAPVALHQLAERSLTAHLLKLQAEGRARVVGGERWQAV
jgi:hypothetical protein